MTPIILESPFAKSEQFTMEENLSYAQRCLRFSLLNNEAPFASHLLYPQSISDSVPESRALGLAAGTAIRKAILNTVFYVDHGMSPGMLAAYHQLEAWNLANRDTIVFRAIGSPLAETDKLFGFIAHISSLVGRRQDLTSHPRGWEENAPPPALHVTAVDRAAR